MELTLFSNSWLTRRKSIFKHWLQGVVDDMGALKAYLLQNVSYRKFSRHYRIQLLGRTVEHIECGLLDPSRIRDGFVSHAC